MWYIHMTEYSLAINRNEVRIYAMTCMVLENIIQLTREQHGVRGTNPLHSQKSMYDF